ncbi:MAG: fibronectin type III domain-containing protein [Nitrospirae bacterium]|nr:fibronectin type III domain-containing protein [Nitrospirota bacterium]
MTSFTPWFWQVLVITAFLYLGLVSEGLASHAVTPTSLTFYAVQSATNPPKKTLTFTKVPTYRATLTASDNATWLTVSPTSQSETTRATITVAVNISGRAAGTYSATITVKEGTWFTKTIPVTLIISPAGGGGGGTTSSATLAWNAVTGTISGYKVYVGEAPRLYSRTITVGTSTSTSVNSLTVGRTYYFAVTAYNSAGESTPSNEVSKTIP